MREILFKAKRKDNGKWEAGYYLKKIKWQRIGDEYVKDEKHYICVNMISSEESYVDPIEVVPETLCQYTGLTDKNGNKIWENDVVSFNHSRLKRISSVDDFGFPDFEMAEYKRNYAIEFVNTYNHYGLRFRNKSIHFPCKCSTLRMHDVEVIGNIFDNPELLKGGAE